MKTAGRPGASLTPPTPQPPRPAHKSQSFGTGANADQKHFPLEAANVWLCQVSEQQDCAGSAAFGWQQLIQTQDINYQPCKLSM